MHEIVPARNRLLLTAGCAFLAGCLSGRLVYGGQWLWLLLAVGLAICIVLLVSKRSLTLGVAICFCALGLLRVMPVLEPEMPPPGRYEEITGVVAGEGKLREDDRVTFTLTKISLDGEPVSGRAYCSLYYDEVQPPALFDGAKVTLSGSVYRPGGKSGEARFDFRQWMLQNRMQFGITSSEQIALHNTPETAPVTDWAHRLKKAFRSKLERTMGDGADLAMALLFSDREGVEEQEYEAFSRLGIAHVMSVSGLHVGLIGTAVYWFLERLRLGKAKWFILAIFLTLYCGLTGFSAAATRAAVMLLMGYGAAALHYPRMSLDHLGAAMLVVLLIQPMQAFSAGFVLSVSAVLGIYLLMPVCMTGLRRIMPEPAWDPEVYKGFSLPAIKRRLHRCGAWLAEAFVFSLSAQLGVLLPTAMYFHQVPVYGVLINALVVPVIALLVPLNLLALAVSPLPWAGPAICTVAGWQNEAVLWAVQLLDRLPMASVRVGRVAEWWLVAALVAAVALSRAVRAKVWQRIVAVVATVLVVAGVLVCTAPPETRYVQMSVGRADAALLFDREKTIAIDVGEDASATLDYLVAEGRDLDALYLTHLHVDHAGGVPELLEGGIRIHQVYLPADAALQQLNEEALSVLDRLQEAGVPIREIAAGEVHTYPSVTITALWPKAATLRSGQDANDLPLVLALDLEGYRLLNAADLTAHYENYVAIPCDVLKVAHHGSANSTSDLFLDRTSPRLALISCTSGSPGEKTLERLAQRGIPCLRTDEAGDITLYVKNGQLMAVPYKGEGNR